MIMVGDYQQIIDQIEEKLTNARGYL